MEMSEIKVTYLTFLCCAIITISIRAFEMPLNTVSNKLINSAYSALIANVSAKEHFLTISNVELISAEELVSLYINFFLFFLTLRTVRMNVNTQKTKKKDNKQSSSMNYFSLCHCFVTDRLK